MSTSLIQTFAGALWGLQIGSNTMAAVNAEVEANGLNATFNKYFTKEHGAKTPTAIGELLVANLGIPEAGKAVAVAYVVGKLAAADESTHGEVISGILTDFAGLTADTVFGTAATAWNAKVAIAVAYTGASDVAVGTVVGGAFTLTTSADTFTGNAGADTFNGTISALSTSATLNATDKIDGGDGVDTMTVDVGADFTGFTTGSVKAVENIELNNAGTIARTFTAVGVTGVDQYSLTGPVNLARLAEIDTVVAGTRTADLTIAYTATVTDGTADSLNLSVTDFGKIDDATTLTTDEENPVTITVAGIETTNVTVAGTNALDLSGVASKAMTLAGAGTLVVTDLNAATKTIDGSALTANTELRLADVTDATAVSTGSGDDVIAVTIDDDLTANASVAGGAGADTLLVTNGAAVTTQLVQSGIETLSFGDLVGPLTMSLKNTTDVANIVALGEAADSGDMDQNVTLATVGANAIAVSLQGVNASSAVLSVDNASATTISVNTPASTATTTAPSVNTVDVTLGNATSVDMTVASKMEYQGTVTATKASSVSLNIAGAATATTISAAAATALTIGSVAVNSAVNLNAAKATSLTIANAKDLDLSGSTLSALETLSSSGAGDLDLAGEALAKLNVATITNKGDVDLNNLGSATLDYGVSVTSTGAATFDVGTITTNSQAVNLTVDAIGAVTAGAIAAGTGAVTVEVDTTSTVALNAITGKNVTVDMSGALGAVTYAGDINASGSLVIKGNELLANDLDGTGAGNIVLAGSAQTVSLTGGIDNDTFLIDNATTTTSVTVTGDLGLGTNSIVVNLTAAVLAAAATVSISGLSNYDSATINLSAAKAATVTLGGGTNADTLVYAGAVKATVSGFDTTEDDINVEGLGATGTANAVTSGGVTADDFEDNDLYVISNGAVALTAAGTETITDYTSLTDVAAYLAEGYTVATATDVAVFAINDLVGNKTYIYSFTENGGGPTITSAELTLVGVITEESGAALVVGDFVV